MGRHANRGRTEDDGAPPAEVCAGGGGALSASLSYRSLLTGAIDYAGLFPPASLSMADAAAEYARHREAPDEWALGRFVVPIARWQELEQLVRQRGERWPVSLLAGCGEAAAIRALTASESLDVRAVECKAETLADADAAAAIVHSGVEVFVEPAAGVDVAALAERLKSIGAAGKIRTGGVTASAFPTSQHVLSFLKACRKAGIRFKATAGLHHAVRGEYRLTYEPSPPTGVMFGFLNIGVAAALLWFGADDPALPAALEETSQEAFDFTDAGLVWRDHQLTNAQLDEVRAEFFMGFGSCSFREPMMELGLEAVPQQ